MWQEQCDSTRTKQSEFQHRGHGPHWVLTTRVHGKTRTRAIPEAALAATRAQIAECQRLRRLVEQLIRVSETACDARVQALRRRPPAPEPAAPGKNSGRRNWPPRPRPNSTAS